jgi:hypothetical protein
MENLGTPKKIDGSTNMARQYMGFAEVHTKMEIGAGPVIRIINSTCILLNLL